ncbi:MAG: hypothetical protein AAGA56_03460 [Myxococcota bacterium]
MAELPGQEEVHDLLADLLGREVVLRPGGRFRSKNGGSVAVYIDDEDQVAAFGIADIPFAAYAGAALALMPARQAHEAVELNKLTDELRENYREVVNIGASLFCHAGPHVRLRDTHELTREALGPELVDMLRRPKRKIVYQVNVSQYGRGKLALAVM